MCVIVIIIIIIIIIYYYYFFHHFRVTSSKENFFSQEMFNLHLASWKVRVFGPRKWPILTTYLNLTSVALWPDHRAQVRRQ